MVATGTTCSEGPPITVYDQSMDGDAGNDTLYETNTGSNWAGLYGGTMTTPTSSVAMPRSTKQEEPTR